MITNQLTEMAGHAAGRYEDFLDRLRAVYSRAISHPNFGSAAHRSDVIQASGIEASKFLGAEISALENDANQIFTEAHQTTIAQLQSTTPDDFVDAAVEHLQHSLNYLYESINDQVRRDLAKLKSAVNTAMFEVNVSARSQRISHLSAHREYRVIKSGDVTFGFRDRANRVWQSEKFVRTLYRQTLLSIYNETVLLTLADHGVDAAYVHHADGKAEVNGIKVALTFSQNLPIYSDIRDEIFHPNANAYLSMEDPLV